VWSTVPLVFIQALSEPSVEQATRNSTLSLFVAIEIEIRKTIVNQQDKLRMNSKTAQPVSIIANGNLPGNENRTDNSWEHNPMSEKTYAIRVGKDGYIPHPLDLSKVTLPEDQQSKVETIAMNVHEVWAAKRIAEGWRYGTTRDDELKFHPCLCRYEDLPESEKEYDRSTVETTLKALRHLSEQPNLSSK